LHPIAISNIANTSSTTYALVEMLFAIGAIAGGVVVGNQVKTCRNISALLRYSLLFFAATAIIQAMFPNYWGFICISFFLGFWNSVVRIFRQTLLMHYVRKHDLGKISAFLQSFIMLMRALTIFMVTIVIAGISVNHAIIFVAILSTVGSIVYMIASYNYNIKEIITNNYHLDIEEI